MDAVIAGAAGGGPSKWTITGGRRGVSAARTAAAARIARPQGTYRVLTIPAPLFSVNRLTHRPAPSVSAGGVAHLEYQTHFPQHVEPGQPSQLARPAWSGVISPSCAAALRGGCPCKGPWSSPRRAPAGR